DLAVRIARPQIGTGGACKIGHDGVGLPEPGLAVGKRRHLGIRIDGEILRGPVLALGQIDAHELHGRAEVFGNGARFPRVDGFEVVELHFAPPLLSCGPTGVIQPMPAPLGSCSMAIRPTWGTSKIGIASSAPALIALATRASTSSTARNDIQLAG